MSDVRGILVQSEKRLDLDVFPVADDGLTSLSTTILHDAESMLRVTELSSGYATAYRRGNPRIGYAALQQRAPGQYEASYELTEQGGWRGQGIIAAAMRQLVVTVAAEDEAFAAVDFQVNPSNHEGLQVAQTLGAVFDQDGPNGFWLRLRLSAKDFQPLTQAQRMAHVG